jgi:hypothetical protein
MHFEGNIEHIHQVNSSFVGWPPRLECFMYMWHVLLVS